MLIAPASDRAQAVLLGRPQLSFGDQHLQRHRHLPAGVTGVDGRVVSDVANDVADVAGWLSPRVGGVGPMTRAMLLANAVAAAERSVA